MLKPIQLLSLVILLSFNISFSQSETPEVELTDLIKELIITKKNGEIMQQVWWLPQIYWELSLKDSSIGSQSLIDDINSTLEDYSIILAIDVTIKPLSGIKKNNIENIELIIKDKKYTPLNKYPRRCKSIIRCS